MKKKDVILTLELLVGQRFTLETLQAQLSEVFDAPIKLEDATQEEDDVTADYNLMGNLDKDGVFCDFDIYYLKTRIAGFDGSNIYVTEVGYEFS